MTKRRSRKKVFTSQPVPVVSERALMSTRLWLLLGGILVFALFLRLAGIWRVEPINYHADDWVLARAVLELANEGVSGEKAHYKWPGCGVIYPLGYSLYAVKSIFGPYSYNNVLVIQRVMSAIASTLAVLAGFLLVRRVASIRAAFFAAALLAVAKLAVVQGHYGTVTSTVSLIILLMMWLLYDLFDCDEKMAFSSVKLRRCCALGFLIGWGIASKWTILLSALPVSGAFLLSCWNNRTRGQWSTFMGLNGIRVVIILAVAGISFLVSMPDVRHYPEKVREGIEYEIEHNKQGHLGEFRVENSTPSKRFARTISMLNRAGGPYLLVAALAAVIFCLVRPTRGRVFLLYVMFLWLFVLYRNIVSAERHHLVPFSMMIVLVAIAADAFWGDPRRYLAWGVRGVLIFVVVTELLYACVAASPFWKPEARLECARWIRDNCPPGTGVSGTPHSPAWVLPGRLVGRAELAPFSPRSVPGKDFYYMAPMRSLNIFKKHPPDRPVNPQEWFYGTPPSQQVLEFYAELNRGGGNRYTLVEHFFAKPSFLGFDMRFFGQPSDTDSTFANRSVTLFRVNRRPSR